MNESCLSDTTFSDIVLLVDGERFQCHRVILVCFFAMIGCLPIWYSLFSNGKTHISNMQAAASAPLRAMFVSPMKESQSSEIELKGIEGGASTFR